ncbi:YqeG family HAD IIIA-type phosphatase [bacterium]|nr:YqeG family HAD IIIA-type phosphatase [bacterium]
MIYASQLRLIRSLLSPNLVCSSIHDIPLEQLMKSGYTSLWLDVDNTLVGVTQREATLRTLNWIQAAKSLGYSVFIVSNNRSQLRVDRICTQLGVDGIYRAMKPLPHSLKDFAQSRKIDLRRGIIVGDQLFTDIIVGNWVRGFSVLVDPLDKKLSLFKTVQRELELFFLERVAGSSRSIRKRADR